MIPAASGTGFDRLLVEAHGVEGAAFDPGDFRTYQCGAVFEILLAILSDPSDPAEGGRNLHPARLCAPEIFWVLRHSGCTCNDEFRRGPNILPMEPRDGDLPPCLCLPSCSFPGIPDV
jgi:hypothetical protein